MNKQTSNDNVYEALSKDALMKECLDNLTLSNFSVQPNLYQELTAAIIYQQISTKAADAVYLRFKDALGWDYTYDSIMQVKVDELRQCGLSRQKCGYIHNIAKYFRDNPEIETVLDGLSDTDVINRLVEIKGVGIWTAKMAMMFYMQRQDIFPYEDLGVRQAMETLYNITGEPKDIIQQMQQIAEQWRPYRSTASFYLWAWKRSQVKKNSLRY